MLRGLKVCYLAGTLERGGAERQLYYALRALSAAGAEPRLLTLTQGEFWEEPIRRLGVDVVCVGRQRSRRARAMAIARELRRRSAAIVQSQHFYTNLYAVAGARASGGRDIGALRSDALSEVRSNGQILGTMSLRLPSLLAANSRQGVENARRLGVSAERLFMLPNVVDVETFASRIPHDGDTVRVISVGRMGPEKRFDRLLRVIAELRRHVARPIAVRLVGEGPLRPELERQVEALGLQEIVRFTGVVAEVGRLYRESDLLLLTSDYEGTPNVVLEAMACGLPVVASRVGGVADVLRDGECGAIVSADDEAGFVRATIALVSDDALRERMGRRAREVISAGHALPRLQGELGRLYFRALAGRA